MLDNLGNVLLTMTAVIVVGCLAWGAAAHWVSRRRAMQILQEFHTPTDAELVAGLRRLSRAVQTQQARDFTRDMHRRHWR
jgi:hypothetical protein